MLIEFEDVGSGVDVVVCLTPGWGGGMVELGMVPFTERRGGGKVGWLVGR